MKLHLLNTLQGLKPMYDQDFDEKKKLKIGECYVAEIKLIRNLEFHRKYFALLNCAWEFQNEKVQDHFKTFEGFRKTVQIAAGHSTTYYSIKRKEWVEESRSIDFSSMDNAAFQDLYERVKTVLFDVFLKHISEQEFMRALSNF